MDARDDDDARGGGNVWDAGAVERERAKRDVRDGLREWTDAVAIDDDETAVGPASFLSRYGHGSIGVGDAALRLEPT